MGDNAPGLERRTTVRRCDGALETDRRNDERYGSPTGARRTPTCASSSRNMREAARTVGASFGETGDTGRASDSDVRQPQLWTRTRDRLPGRGRDSSEGNERGGGTPHLRTREPCRVRARRTTLDRRRRVRKEAYEHERVSGAGDRYRHSTRSPSAFGTCVPQLVISKEVPR